MNYGSNLKQKTNSKPAVPAGNLIRGIKIVANRFLLIPLLALFLALEYDLPEAQAQTPTSTSGENKDNAVLKSAVRHNLLAAAEPTLTVSPSNGPVGTVIKLKGSDFPPNNRLNIAIGKINSEAGGSFASSLTDSQGNFEVEIKLIPPSGQQPFPAGEIILMAHNSDYSIKAVVNFNVTAVPGQSSGQPPGKMPGSLPSSGLGNSAGSNPSENLPSLPNFPALLVLLILAVTSFIGLRKLKHPVTQNN